jgi:uncharacterized small protein (DUF1192 family)
MSDAKTKRTRKIVSVDKIDARIAKLKEKRKQVVAKRVGKSAWP